MNPDRTRPGATLISWGQRGALVALGLLISLCLAEVVARIASATPEVDRQPERSVATDYDSLPELTTRSAMMAPNVRGRFNGKLFVTNEQGLRDRDYEVPKPEGVFRIVVIGDSVAMGSGVEEPETYAAILEESLGRGAGLGGRSQPGVSRYEVVNTALSGQTLAHAIGRLRNRGLLYDPDLIVYGFTANDIEGPAYQRTAEPMDHLRRLLERTKAYERSPFHLVRHLGPRMASFEDFLWPPPDSSQQELRNNYNVESLAWADFESALDNLRNTGRARGICVVVFLHATPERLGLLHPYHWIYDQVESAATQRGMHVIPSFPFLRGQNAPELWVARYDPHPNALGHRLLADALQSGLEDLPESCTR